MTLNRCDISDLSPGSSADEVSDIILDRLHEANPEYDREQEHELYNLLDDLVEEVMGHGITDAKVIGRQVIGTPRPCPGHFFLGLGYSSRCVNCGLSREEAFVAIQNVTEEQAVAAVDALRPVKPSALVESEARLLKACEAAGRARANRDKVQASGEPGWGPAKAFRDAESAAVHAARNLIDVYAAVTE